MQAPGPRGPGNGSRSSQRGVVVLGCTGSIGETTFQVLDNLAKQDQSLHVVALSAGGRIERLI